MKIRQVNSFFRTMALREPYSIAYDTVDRCETVFINIITEDGVQGWGCAAPDPLVTGETASGTLKVLNKEVEPILRGEDVFRYAWILDSLKISLPAHPALRAMVDMALHDIVAQKAGVPLFKLLGGFRNTVPTSITIGIMPIKSTLVFAEEYIKRGFKILKIKGGNDLLEDIERINRVRELVGRRVKIRFDANQGYSVEDSLNFLKGVAHAGVELFEQPTRKNDFEKLKLITQQSELPVMADESLISLRDAFFLSRDQCTDLINIKLMKTGGILDAMHVNSVARAAGIGAMVGCMDESALGIAAGLHFALSRPNIQYADLDGHLDILDDPFDGMLMIRDGELFPPESAGLGWKGLQKIKI
jgi:L-alanine-DL-glutamate epimerase-like enolase superfamily enzyme